MGKTGDLHGGIAAGMIGEMEAGPGCTPAVEDSSGSPVSAGGAGSALAVGPRRRVADGGVIGWVEGRSEGPLLLCIGGVHGNEPAGVRALEAMIGKIRARRDAIAGDFVAVAGNVSALAAGRRFMAYDLNRAWIPLRVEALKGGGGPESDDGSVHSIASRRARTPMPEDLEVLRVLELLDRIAARRRGPVYVLDLHTTSGEGGTFTSAEDSPRHRRFAREVPFPFVLGLNGHLEGTLLGYLDTLGYTTMLCECGQHREPRAALRAVAAVWIAVRAAGLLGDGDVPEAGRAGEMLRNTCAHLPRVLETVYRHPFDERDSYVTRPGFRNFQRVREGEAIGDDRHGEVVAPRSGRLLMPLYQRLGEDGFFVVREVGEG